MVEPRRPDHRRRQTVIRKLRRLCDDYNAKVVIVMTEPNNRQWIYKTHDDVPGIQQVSDNEEGYRNNTKVYRLSFILGTGISMILQ